MLRLGLHRNFVASGNPCGHCGNGWATWLCPAGFRCTVCIDCVGVRYHRRHDEKRPDGSMPDPSGWLKLLLAVGARREAA